MTGTLGERLIDALKEANKKGTTPLERPVEPIPEEGEDEQC